MSVRRIKVENKTIIDFNQEVSKNLITKSLYTTKIENIKKTNHATLLINNVIKIGMYHIQLNLDLQQNDKNYLKEYGKFNISISDDIGRINTRQDEKFKDQYWSKLNKINIKQLIDVIIYCVRLNRLRAFS